jgi:UDP-glucose 4-epimerase
MGVKVLITGTGGYLGSVLATQLAKLPEIDGITGLDSALQRSPASDKIKFVQMDIRSPQIADAMQGHDFVIHTACIVQWPSRIPKQVRDDVNLNGTRNMAQAAVKNRIRGFIQASSCAAYDPAMTVGKDNLSEDSPLGKGNSKFYYWNTKSICEKILSETLSSSNVILTLLRMGTIIGRSSPVTLDGILKNAIKIPGLDPRTQYVHEEDAAQAFAQAILTPMPGAYNVVADGFVRMSEFHKIIGAKPMTVSLWMALLVSYIRWRFFDSIIHPSWIQAYLMDFTLDNAKLKATGWKPKYTSREAVESVV